MQFFEYNFLKYAENDKKSLNLIKNNYESCFRNEINAKKITLLSAGAMIVALMTAFLLELIFVILINFDFDLLIKFVLMIVWAISYYYVLKALVDGLSNYLLREVEKTTIIKKNVENNFIIYFCNNGKLSKIELYKYREAYARLNTKLIERRDKYSEIFRVVIVIVLLSIYILWIKPSINAVFSILPMGFAIDLIVMIITNVIPLFVTFQIMDIKKFFTDFTDLINQFDFVILFSCEEYKKYYKIENISDGNIE